MPADIVRRLSSASHFHQLPLVLWRISPQRHPGCAPGAIGCLVCRTLPISPHVFLCRESSSSPCITRPLSSCICPAVFLSRLLITQSQLHRSCIASPTPSLVILYQCYCLPTIRMYSYFDIRNTDGKRPSFMVLGLVRRFVSSQILAPVI